jgi:hypothetical protein
MLSLLSTEELISMTHNPWRLAAVLALTLAAALASPAPSFASEQPSPQFSHDPGFSAEGQGEELGPKAVSRIFPTMPCCGNATTCWSTTTSRSRGWWPYGRTIHLYTLWCAAGGIINYRDSAAWTGQDFTCDPRNLWAGKVGGGAGWWFVDVQAQSDFACDSPWWFDWHDTLMQRIRYHPNGWYETIAYQ